MPSIAWSATVTIARRSRFSSAAPICSTRRAGPTSSRLRPPRSHSCRDSIALRDCGSRRRVSSAGMRAAATRGRQYRWPSDSLRRHRRAGVRRRRAARRCFVRQGDRSHFREIFDRRSARAGLERNKSVANGTRHPHGARLAPARTDMAASILRPRDSGADLSRDCAVATAARGIACAVRAASEGGETWRRMSRDRVY
jgi:hypothetical protein